jgi:hypothetical protein
VHDCRDSIAILPNSCTRFVFYVDPESKVCAQRFKNRIKVNGKQLKLLFKGGMVSSDT